MARGRRPALALDVDETRAARAERRPVRILAELRQRDLELVDRVKDGGARQDVGVTPVDDHSHSRNLAVFMIGLRRGETFRDIVTRMTRVHKTIER
jgi:hypothetical protein